MSPEPFGKTIAKEFCFDPKYRNLNHGSFGTIPRAVQAAQRRYQALAEARPDVFIRYEYPPLLDASRAALARLLRVPADTVVLVSNATVGVNTVLRNLVWHADGRDDILSFDTVYGGCGKAIDFVVEHACPGQVSSRTVPLTYPCADADVLAAFEAAVAASRAAGRRPRLALFDVVSSLPGVCVPYEALIAACKRHGMLSLVDGAQGLGLVPLDLGRADPDFFVSNAHKWLHVPRACAVLYCPARTQPLLVSALGTSHGYVSRTPSGRFNPLPPTPAGKNPFVAMFEFVGTLDNSPYACVTDAVRWRDEILGGEERILAYTTGLARRGGQRVADLLGTEVMENAEGTLGACAMTNIALPVWLEEEDEKRDEGDRLVLRAHEAEPARQWLLGTLMAEYNTFMNVFPYKGRWWVRLSAQVYLDMDDFDFAGRALKELCERLKKKQQVGQDGQQQQQQQQLARL